MKKFIPKPNNPFSSVLSNSFIWGLKYLYFVNVIGYDIIYTNNGESVYIQATLYNDETSVLLNIAIPIRDTV